MQRLNLKPRLDWQLAVESVGLAYHTTDDGAPYWDESACYVFTPPEIDAIEKATYALNDHVQLAAGADIFSGPKDTFFGQLRRNTTFLSELRYAF